jgi:hypothetical protein
LCVLHDQALTALEYRYSPCKISRFVITYRRGGTVAQGFTSNRDSILGFVDLQESDPINPQRLAEQPASLRFNLDRIGQ